MQSPEAFGLPIAECLSCGSYVFTPDSAWPMSWRLDEAPEVHGPGNLPECFVVYRGKDDLKEKIGKIRKSFDSIKTPVTVANCFNRFYPTFYSGNQDALREFIEIMGKMRLQST